MTTTDDNTELLLAGPDGANPLGFLCAIGTLLGANEFQVSARLSWRQTGAGWRPVVHGCGSDAGAFIERIHTTLLDLSMAAFEIDNKLPFAADRFRFALSQAQHVASSDDRALADFLTAFGSEVSTDKQGDFQSSRFRMVRSGDSAGQGLPVYARSIRSSVTAEHLKRALLDAWDYRDGGFSLRWDPVEDQRYALRWRDPSKSSTADGPGTMLAANALAIEALRLFPTFPANTRLRTTGFNRYPDRSVHFSWPIWEHAITIDMLRTLLALAELQQPTPNTVNLAKRGITAVFRSQRIQQNQYYSNFSPAIPA